MDRKPSGDRRQPHQRTRTASLSSAMLCFSVNTSLHFPCLLRSVRISWNRLEPRYNHLSSGGRALVQRHSRGVRANVPKWAKWDQIEREISKGPFAEVLTSSRGCVDQRGAEVLEPNNFREFFTPSSQLPAPWQARYALPMHTRLPVGTLEHYHLPRQWALP
jgi:hypothetical protein